MTHPALIERITRSLAYMLRHQPEKFDLELDRHGFGRLDDVVRALEERLGEPVAADDVHAAVQAGDRPRYEIQGDRIRALYGHSIDVEPGEPARPPEFLYVGIEGRDLGRAQQFGLRGGRRRFLHLALNLDDAREAGRRAAREYSVLRIYALDAWEEGVNFFDRKALFLAEHVPTEYIEVLEQGSDGYEDRVEDQGARRGPGRGHGFGRGEPRRERGPERGDGRGDGRGHERGDGRGDGRGRDRAPARREEFNPTHERSAPQVSRDEEPRDAGVRELQRSDVGRRVEARPEEVRAVGAVQARDERPDRGRRDERRRDDSRAGEPRREWSGGERGSQDRGERGPRSDRGRGEFERRSDGPPRDRAPLGAPLGAPVERSAPKPAAAPAPAGASSAAAAGDFGLGIFDEPAQAPRAASPAAARPRPAPAPQAPPPDSASDFGAGL